MQGADLYCKLYVAGAADADALTVALNEITRSHGAPDAGLVRTAALNISVHAESRHLPLNDEQDDFVLWRHYLEIDAADTHTGFEAFLAGLVEVIVGLRARGLRVVAACDFEDTLEAALRGAASA